MGLFDFVTTAFNGASDIISDPASILDQAQEIVDPSMITDKVSELGGAAGDIAQQATDTIAEPLSVVEDLKNSIGL